MCADNTRSVVMKAIDDGACDYWVKPFTETLIQNMWQHVARKLWNENKNLELSKVEVGMKKRDNLEQESVKKNNDKPESSTKKTRVKWSSELHRKFVSVVKELNKYRDHLKKGETKKQRKQNKTAQATESSEFDFQAYDASTPHVVPNNFIPLVNAVPVNVYQTDSEDDTSSSASINQHNNWSGFETNSIINPSFLNAVNARFPNAQVRNVLLAWHNPSQNSNDSTSSNDL
ncbi:hypothetical protein TSUD_73800 [Trifolium subterraneum]|uniref:Response regulatory domain-containing protein n=1 Tax=Trifolium subterraneum TaxID=3900 RepID=A0A2Z6LKH2_TRISU|nr:hypothetical protein TSUD_73800 [Trifolium subterraneum]